MTYNLTQLVTTKKQQRKQTKCSFLKTKTQSKEQSKKLEK